LSPLIPNLKKWYPNKDENKSSQLKSLATAYEYSLYGKWIKELINMSFTKCGLRSDNCSL